MDPTQFDIAQKSVDWCTQMLKKYNHNTLKHVHKILTGEKLWIYAYDSKIKKQLIVWVFQGEPDPTKFVHVQSSSKQKVTCFFNINGYVATVQLEQHRTIILNNTQSFACQKCSKKYGKKTER